MRATEYIKLLEELVDQHGDLECVDSQNEPIGYPEFGADEGTGDGDAFVLAAEA